MVVFRLLRYFGGESVCDGVDRTLDEARLRLRDMRSIRGYTQRYVEKRTGIKQPLLSAYESGSRELGLKDILLLCACYECSLSYILGETQMQLPEKQEDISLDQALSLGQQLAAPLDENEKTLCDTYLRLRIYNVIRALYTSNPRHKSTRLFRVSQQQLQKALAASDEDIERILKGGLSIKPARAGRIELDCEYSAALRAFVKATEDLIAPP